MSIISDIKSFLQQAKTLQLAGLGQFHVRRFNARYDASKQQMLPATERLMFDFEPECVTTNQLIQWIAQRNHIVIEQAEQRLQSWVSTIVNVSYNNGTCEIEDLGTFKSTTDQSLIFTDKNVPSVSHFGLPKVNLVKRKTAVTPSVYIAAPKKKKSRRAPIILLGCFLLLVGAIALKYFDFNSSSVHATADQSMYEDTTQRRSITADKNPVPYYVVIGSFQQIDNAISLAAKVSNDDTNAHILFTETQFTQVGVLVHAHSESEAQTELNSWRKRYKGAWLKEGNVN